MTAVYIHPKADTKDALKDLKTVISATENKDPDTLSIISGDFNQANTAQAYYSSDLSQAILHNHSFKSSSSSTHTLHNLFSQLTGRNYGAHEETAHTHFLCPPSAKSWRDRSRQAFTCSGLRLEASTPNRVWSPTSQSNLAYITCTTFQYYHTPTGKLGQMTCIQSIAPIHLQDWPLDPRLARVLTAVTSAKLDLSELSLLEALVLLRFDPKTPLVDARRVELLHTQAQLALFHYCLFSQYKQQQYHLQQHQQQQQQQRGHIIPTPLTAPTSALSAHTLPVSLLGFRMGPSVTSHFPALTLGLESGGSGPMSGVDGGHVESGSERLGSLLVLLQLLSTVEAAGVERSLFPDLNVQAIVRSSFLSGFGKLKHVPYPKTPLVDARRVELLHTQAQLALFHYCLFSQYKQQQYHLQQHQQQQQQRGHIIPTPLTAPTSALSAHTLPVSLLGFRMGPSVTSHFPALTLGLESGGSGPMSGVDGGHVESGSERLGSLLVLLQLISTVEAAGVERSLFPDLNVQAIVRSAFSGT
ncbi:hypothetical protein EGW08_021989 [Elysia chlorotica]|uniref:Uncharacterized protein n=1 Tax=Elysia chlorotica TaxID=188477 RepID=A0A433SM44_ELYCH|nr:hypothetical protein EGW08_021989 [Elysia chlorotica]